MYSSRSWKIEKPRTPRPGGIPQGSVLVVLDVTKEVSTAPVYWALGNVVRHGDNFKILGIMTHLCNPMGFRVRVDKNSWIGSNALMLHHELAMKKKSLEDIPQLQEWCEKAGVKLELDLKAGYTTKTIIVDEAKAIGAYHVVLDKSMKSNKKYFIEHLTCFVSRARQSGGVETLRSFSVTNQLPPLLPTPPNLSRPGNYTMPSSGSMRSMSSLLSNSSKDRSSMASTVSYDNTSSDGFLTQDSDQLSGAPSTVESVERHHQIQEVYTNQSSMPVRALHGSSSAQEANCIEDFSRQPPAEVETMHNSVNRQPAFRKWLAEDDLSVTRSSYQNSNAQTFSNRSNGNDTLPMAAAQEQFRRTRNYSGPINPASLSLASARTFTPLNVPAWMDPNAILQPSTPFSRRSAPPNTKLAQSLPKMVWIWTRSKEVMQSAVEVGWTNFVFTRNTKDLATQLTSVEWINPLSLEGTQFVNKEGKQVATLGQVYSGNQLQHLVEMTGRAETIVINDLDWEIISPKDIVAAFQGRCTNLFATASCAADARVYLEALEVGTDGVVLQTDNCSEITALRDYLTSKIVKKHATNCSSIEPLVNKASELKSMSDTVSLVRSRTNSLHRVSSTSRSEAIPRNGIGPSRRLVESPKCHAQTSSALPAPLGLRLINATVKSVVSVGEGDRVAVDLCNLLNPGEALLVGSFSKGMFLVHSEVQANNSSRRSFRVNAGPVHAYTGISGGHITYLSELESGGQVLAVDAHGHSRTVLVGRVSIESKPLVLVVAEAEGECFSVMLEDADSVRLVVPSYMQHPGSEAIPVTKLQPGDMILLGMEVGDYTYGQ